MRAGRCFRLAAIGAECCFRVLTGHDAGCNLGDRGADRLGHERNRTRCTRIDFENEDFAVLDGELHIHQAADMKRLGKRCRLAFQFGNGFRRKCMHRQRAGRVARMDTGFLDMLHDTGDKAVLAVTQAVDVHFNGFRQIGIEQKRVLAEQRVDLAGLVVRILGLDVFRHQLRHGVEQIVLQRAFIMDDLHGAATENIRWAHDKREAEVGCDEACLLHRIGNAVLRLVEIKLDQQLLKTVTIFRKVDGVWRGAEDRDAGLFKRIGELERVWPPNCTMTP